MSKYELNFYDYWRIIRRRRWIIGFSFLVVLGASILYTNRQIPVYEASTTVKIEERRTITGLLLTDWFTYSPGDVMTTEAQVIESYPIAEDAARRLGWIDEESAPAEVGRRACAIQDMVSTERLERSNLIQIRVVSNNPEEAAQVANTVAQVYKDKDTEKRNKQAREMREFIERQLRMTEIKLANAEEALKEFKERGAATGVALSLGNKLTDLEFKLASLLERYTEKHPEVVELKAKVASLKEQLKLVPAEDLELARLTREVKVNEESYTMLNKKYKEALITEAEKVEFVSIVNPAVEPGSPIGPSRGLNVIVGGIIGLLLGFVFAFIRENLDTSIGRVEEVEDYLKVPVLGIVPHITAGEEGGRPFRRRLSQEEKISKLRAQLVAHFQPKSSVAEAYRSLQTNIGFAQAARKRHTLLFTSTGPLEGKSITAANCAVALAQMGKKVLLIESDLRRPVLHRMFGLAKDPGLADILVGNLKWQEAQKTVTDMILGEMGLEDILKTPGIENLSIITSGSLPPNPLEILNLPAMEELIRELKGEFDVLIFDSPPILPVADAVVLGSKLEGTVLVYRAGRTARGALRRAKALLDSVKANVLGIVLNDIRAAEMKPSYPYYYYSKYYGVEEKARRRRGSLLAARGRDIFAVLKDVFKRRKHK